MTSLLAFLSLYTTTSAVTTRVLQIFELFAHTFATSSFLYYKPVKAPLMLVYYKNY